MTSSILHDRDFSRTHSRFANLILIIVALALAATSELNASSEEDAKRVAALDTKYQAAVKANDATTMDQILADDFICKVAVLHAMNATPANVL